MSIKQFLFSNMISKKLLLPVSAKHGTIPEAKIWQMMSTNSFIVSVSLLYTKGSEYTNHVDCCWTQSGNSTNTSLEFETKLSNIQLY